MEISIQDLWKILLKKWFIILLCAILCAALLATYVNLTTEDSYTASSTVYLTANQQMEDKVTSSSIDLAERLVEGYIIMLKSNSVLDQVSALCTPENGCSEHYSTGRLKGIISISQVQKSWIFEIRVTTKNPKDAVFIANAVAEEGTQVIRDRILKAGQAQPLDHAQVASLNQVNTLKYVLLGGLGGAVLAYLIALLVFLMDTGVHSEADLRSMFQYPVIGVIPDFIEGNSKKGYYRYAYRTTNDGNKGERK